MKHLLYIILCVLCVSNAASGQDYYWYRGKQIPLTRGKQSYILYEDTNLKVEEEMQITERGDITYSNRTNLKWGIVNQQLNHIHIGATNILYQISSFHGQDTTQNIFVTHRFYVKLKTSVDYMLLQSMVNQYHAEIEKEGDFPLWFVVRCGLESGYNALELSNIFYESGLFAVSEPEFTHVINANCVNDTKFNDQWNLRNWGQHWLSNGDVDIKYCNARSITTGKSSIIIGVYDRGVDLIHPDINIHAFSYDANSNTSPSQVYHYHGTACAGIIGAKTNNNLGIAGIAPDCPIMSLSMGESISTYNLGLGFKVAVDNGCAVISNSWDAKVFSSWVDECISYALTTGRSGLGSVVVFAAGNDNTDSISYPANSNDSILVVGAMSPCGERCNPYSCDAETWWGSNYGEQLDIMAPGVDIPTTDISGVLGKTNLDYMDDFNGTSSACPHVAAVAGLILSVNPNLTSKEVADIIESTAQKDDSSYFTIYPNRPNGTWNEYFGYGLVDAYAAVIEAKNRYEQFIQGPNYVCDTTEYHLVRPSLPGETVAWSVYNALYEYPHYSIVGPNNQDTVYVRCERMNIAPPPSPIRNEFEEGGNRFPIDSIQKLKVTITEGTTTCTYKKEFREPAAGEIPEVSASSSSSIWHSGTSRTFTITNCTAIPNSALTWEVRKETLTPTPSVTISNYIGRTLTYTATAPIGCLTSIQITATNTLKECAPRSVSLSFIIYRKKQLLTYENGDILQVIIYDDEEGHSIQCANDNYPLTLELWHDIYGRMSSQTVQNANEQIDVTGFPQGVYVVLLKGNGNIIAESKVQLH